MKVVIATPILYDPTSPFNHLFKDIIGGFLDAGYEVERYVAVRNETEDGYKYGYENVEYRKYKRKESAHRDIITRYIRDTLTNIREAKGVKKSGADVLFEDVSYSSFWTVRAAKKKGMCVVSMLQDVWPDNAVQSGIIKRNGLLYKFFEIWQRYVYKHTDKIICISDDMKDFIVSKGVNENKIEVIYNWGYSDEIINIPWNDNEFVKKYKLDHNKFYVVYAGNIGKMQNVELVVKAAKRLKNHQDIHFLIVGEGAKRESIEEMTKGMLNITMLPFQPSNIATHIYSMAGVNIIPLVEGGSKTAMPSKTGVVLSCGRPVIFCFGSESGFARKLKDYSAGLSVSATDEHELAEAILSYAQMTSSRNIGSDKMFEELFVKSNNVEKYITVLNIINTRS